MTGRSRAGEKRRKARAVHRDLDVIVERSSVNKEGNEVPSSNLWPAPLIVIENTSDAGFFADGAHWTCRCFPEERRNETGLRDLSPAKTKKLFPIDKYSRR
jgi:hypothetical protein